MLLRVDTLLIVLMEPFRTWTATSLKELCLKILYKQFLLSYRDQLYPKTCHAFPDSENDNCPGCKITLLKAIMTVLTHLATFYIHNCNEKESNGAPSQHPRWNNPPRSTVQWGIHGKSAASQQRARVSQQVSTSRRYSIYTIASYITSL